MGCFVISGVDPALRFVGRDTWDTRKAEVRGEAGRGENGAREARPTQLLSVVGVVKGGTEPALVPSRRAVYDVVLRLALPT